MDNFGDVIKIPSHRRAECRQSPQHVRIESTDGDGWDKPSSEEARILDQFLEREEIDGTAYLPSKFVRLGGVRIGYNKGGMYIHKDHLKRYFGFVRHAASIMMAKAAPEAVPLFQGPGSIEHQGSEGLLSKLASSMPVISDEVRKQVFRATFATADANKNGTLSRPELGAMMRKIVPTMSAQDARDLMDAADADDNNAVCFDEFVTWLNTSAPDKVQGAIKKSLNNESDIVRASFRVWDRNGDGLINKTEIIRVMREHCKTLTKKQIEALCKTMDTDNDGKVDYDEFIDFLFHRK